MKNITKELHKKLKEFAQKTTPKELLLSGLIFLMFVILLITLFITYTNSWKVQGRIVDSIQHSNEHFIAIIDYEREGRVLEQTDIDGKTLFKISKSGQQVIEFTQSNDRNIIAYSAKDTSDNLQIWTYNIQTENYSIIDKDIQHNQALFAISNDNSMMAIATPSELFSYDLKTRDFKNLQSYNEFGDDSEIVFVPRPFWTEDGYIIIETRNDDYMRAHATTTYKINVEDGSSQIISITDDFTRAY